MLMPKRNKINLDKNNLDFLLAQYKVISDRHINHNQILWRVPAIFFTAQAVLLVLAIGVKDVPQWAQFGSSVLLVLFSILSLQIFERNRLMTVADAEQLLDIEKLFAENGYASLIVHHTIIERNFLDGKSLFLKLEKMHKFNCLNRKKSYILWRIGFTITILGSIGLLVYQIYLLF